MESGVGYFFNDPIVHWYRNIFSHVPCDQGAGDRGDIVAAREKAIQVMEKLRALRLTKPAELAEAAVEETLT